MAIVQHPADAAFADPIYCLGWVTASVVVGFALYQNSAAADFFAAPLADFVDPVVAGYSSPAADPRFAADSFVIVGPAVVAVAAAAVAAAAVAAAAVAAAPFAAGLGLCLSFDLFYSADFVAAVVAAVSDASSAAQSFS